MSTLLVADIGGTKIDFALIDSGSLEFKPIYQGQLQSARYQSCSEVIAACLAAYSGRVDFASLAVAGPVVEQQVAFTNLPWQTGAFALKDAFGFAGVVLVNDLAALAESVDLFGADDVRVVKPAAPGDAGFGHGGSLVAAPGTGLGAALIFRDSMGSWLQATEAGHLSFSPRNEVEEQLLTFLHKKHPHVSFEMVCSGSGLVNIFDFLVSSGFSVPEALIEKSRQGHDLASLLSQRALAEDVDCPLSTRTYALFFDTLAEFCGNLALTLMPGSAVYLGGGMLPRLNGLFDQERFVRRFTDRGKMQELVAAMPIYLITHAHAPLLGAWRLGRRIFL